MGFEENLKGLAEQLIECDCTESGCTGIRCSRVQGIVPRYFGIYPGLDKRRVIDAVICGENPGRASFCESMWWVTVLKDRIDGYSAYKDYVKVGV